MNCGTKKCLQKIHRDNQRAVKAFLNAGFSVEDKEWLFHSFSITMDRYLDIVKASATAPEYSDHAPCSEENDSETLLISSADLEKLRRYTEYQTYIPEPIEPYVEELKCEIANARVTDPEKIPENVITMNSIATIEINGQEMEISLVYPHDADHDNQKISILSPLGTAIIGNRKGDTIKRTLESEYVSISIRDILYQPESSGDYHL